MRRDDARRLFGRRECGGREETHSDGEGDSIHADGPEVGTTGRDDTDCTSNSGSRMGQISDTFVARDLDHGREYKRRPPRLIEPLSSSFRSRASAPARSSIGMSTKSRQVLQADPSTAALPVPHARGRCKCKTEDCSWHSVEAAGHDLRHVAQGFGNREYHEARRLGSSVALSNNRYPVAATAPLPIRADSADGELDSPGGAFSADDATAGLHRCLTRLAATSASASSKSWWRRSEHWLKKYSRRMEKYGFVSHNGEPRHRIDLLGGQYRLRVSNRIGRFVRFRVTDK